MKTTKSHSARFTVLWLCVAAVALTAILFFLVVPAICAYRFLNPEKQPMTTFPHELGLAYEYRDITAPDGNLMASWFIPAQTPGRPGEAGTPEPTDKTVIFSHNYESNKDMEEINALYLARTLAQNGYNVLLFDYSGSGSSTGSGYYLGAREAGELSAVIDYAKKELPAEHLSVIGWAFGAAAALMVADSRVEAVIADSSYCRLNTYLERNIHVLSDTPSFLNPVTVMFCRMWSGLDFEAYQPLKSVAGTSGLRYFFIQGSDDTVIPQNSYSLLAAAAAAANETETWRISGSGHIMGYRDQPENYASRVLQFLNNDKPDENE